jgi:hypothetical protein
MLLCLKIEAKPRTESGLGVIQETKRNADRMKVLHPKCEFCYPVSRGY